jgi:hypothetical protein
MFPEKEMYIGIMYALLYILGLEIDVKIVRLISSMFKVVFLVTFPPVRVDRVLVSDLKPSQQLNVMNIFFGDQLCQFEADICPKLVHLVTKEDFIRRNFTVS